MKKRVILGVTGSIAAYKAAELVRLMKGRGWDVTVIMTPAATRFVGVTTFQTLSGRPVAVDLFPDVPRAVVEHVSLAEQADVLVIAPCTANVLAQLAHGLADSLLTCTALACTAPLVIAPAMNGRMWDHPATQANVGTLRSRGVHVMDVETGALAAGEGRGRMPSAEKILAAAAQCLGA